MKFTLRFYKHSVQNVKEYNHYVSFFLDINYKTKRSKYRCVKNCK